MKCTALNCKTTFQNPLHCRSSLSSLPPFSRQISFISIRRQLPFFSISIGLHNRPYVSVRLNASSSSAWDDEPYEILPSGKKSYFDEQDVVTLLDPPKELIPLDSASYNPASYLWKKIDEIPEERRHRLLDLLKPKLILRAWEMAGTRYEGPNFVKKNASNLLSNEAGEMLPEFYSCQSSGGPGPGPGPWPRPISWINSFKQALFSDKNGKIYGRFISGFAPGLVSSFSPSYFSVIELDEVMSTEQPCDLAFELGDGLFDLSEYPEGFPKAAKHPYPFNDQVVIYVRHIGPGVLVGQAWQEGKELHQVPRKLCSEILMVKEEKKYICVSVANEGKFGV